MKAEKSEKEIAAETAARGRQAIKDMGTALNTMDRKLKDPNKK